MTYCLGVLLSSGLVMASDSRSNAGVDQITTVKKMSLFVEPGMRALTLLGAGNLATTQAVVNALKQNFRAGLSEMDLNASRDMFDAAQTVGTALRNVLARDGSYVSSFGDPNASFLLGGQIAGEAPRLFKIFSAGNFVEATPRAPFQQIGEAKYGKPILDRAVTYETDLTRAAKCALLSMDATMRSNLTVAPPIDVHVYRADSLSAAHVVKLRDDDAYLEGLRRAYGDALLNVVDSLPDPEWA